MKSLEKIDRSNSSPDIQKSKTITSLKRSLMTSVSEKSVSEVAGEFDERAASALAMLSVEVNASTALKAKKIFQAERSLGKTDLLKIMAFIIKSFCDSVKCPPERKLYSYEIVEVARELLNIYTHESVEDFILAFKMAKMRGRKFYNQVGASDIFEIVNTYFEEYKPAQIERNIQYEKDLEKAGQGTLEDLYENMGDRLNAFKNMILPQDANKEHKRLHINISKAKGKRGLQSARRSDSTRQMDKFSRDFHQRITDRGNNTDK